MGTGAVLLNPNGQLARANGAEGARFITYLSGILSDIRRVLL